MKFSFTTIFLCLLLTSLACSQRTTCADDDFGDQELRDFLKCTCMEERCNHQYEGVDILTVKQNCKQCTHVCMLIHKLVSHKWNMKNRVKAAADRCAGEEQHMAFLYHQHTLPKLPESKTKIDLISF